VSLLKMGNRLEYQKNYLKIIKNIFKQSNYFNQTILK
jgi:hypothetical protein